MKKKKKCKNNEIKKRKKNKYKESVEGKQTEDMTRTYNRITVKTKKKRHDTGNKQTYLK